MSSRDLPSAMPAWLLLPSELPLMSLQLPTTSATATLTSWWLAAARRLSSLWAWADLWHAGGRELFLLSYPMLGMLCYACGRPWVATDVQRSVAFHPAALVWSYSLPAELLASGMMSLSGRHGHGIPTATVL